MLILFRFQRQYRALRYVELKNIHRQGQSQLEAELQSEATLGSKKGTHLG